jgi:small-conductance mechanosensitive channel
MGGIVPLNSLWHVINQYANKHSGQLFHAAGDVAKIIVLYIVARITIRIISRVANRLLTMKAVKIDQRRKNTLISLSDNVIKYSIYFILLLMVMQTVGFHIETLLAGAGIAGLAIGFGAQNIIKDILTGLFILFEDQFGVGDMVKINQFTGTVQSIGIRLTKIQAWTGEIENIPNGQIQQVTNYSKSNSIAVIDVGISYDTPIELAMGIMKRVLDELAGHEENVVGPVQVLGVQALGESDVVLRATVECQPTTHFGIQRLARKRIKEAFNEAQIDIPFPQRVVWMQSADQSV